MVVNAQTCAHSIRLSASVTLDHLAMPPSVTRVMQIDAVPLSVPSGFKPVTLVIKAPETRDFVFLEERFAPAELVYLVSNTLERKSS